MRAALLAGVLCLGILVRGEPTGASGICPAELGAQIDAIARRSPFQRARWGILVRTLEQGETLYQREGDRLFIPASNAKLLSTAAALTRLGPEFRIRTVVQQEETGAVLRVLGQGDPSFNQTHLQDLARQLRQRGIVQSDRLIADDSYFRGDPVNPNWEWEDIQAGYGAPVNSLIVNRNEVVVNLLPQRLGQPLRLIWQNPTDNQFWRVENTSRTVASNQPEFVGLGRDGARAILRVSGQLRVGSNPEDASISVPDPAQNFLQQFLRVLAAAGVQVRSGGVVGGRVPADTPPGTEVAAVLSPPLAELLREANANSDNLHAEALLRILGESTRTSPSSPSTSLAAGLAAIAPTLQPLGVPSGSFALADGSGLSRKNLASPEALVETLRGMHRLGDRQQAQVYRNSLAVAGVSGTLRNRFQATPVQGRLWGKTGAISGIAALSGYLEPLHSPPLAFSILVNHFDQPVRTVRPAIDEIVLLLAQLQTPAECDR